MANDRKPGDDDTLQGDVSQIADRPIPQDAALVVLTGPELGKRYPLPRGGRLSIGRSAECTIRLEEQGVSRLHVELVSGAEVLLKDRSKNGTLINDELAKERVLRHGDLLKVASSVFKFISGGNIEQIYYDEIHILTTVDGLTQINNRRYFLQQLDQEISRCQRYERALSIGMLDIDHFKAINDEHGHLVGDQVLRKLSAILRGRLRREDTVARYGGEEFGLLFPETALDQARIAAEGLRSLVEGQPFTFDGASMKITVSIGLTQCLIKGPQTGEDLIRAADEKLYKAKQEGRNKVCG